MFHFPMSLIKVHIEENVEAWRIKIYTVALDGELLLMFTVDRIIGIALECRSLCE